VYLQSLGGSAAAGSSPGSAPGASSAPSAKAVGSSGPGFNPATDPTALALRAGDAGFLQANPGALVYLNNCSACHRSDGEGARRTFPALSRSSSVAATDPTSLIRIVLAGSDMPHTETAPSELGMPSLGWRLGDDKVAEVLSFVRRSWGNQAAAVTAKDVASVRAALPADIELQTVKILPPKNIDVRAKP
jgi:mono/diheme cytochrome c family protein